MAVFTRPSLDRCVYTYQSTVSTRHLFINQYLPDHLMVFCGKLTKDSLTGDASNPQTREEQAIKVLINTKARPSIPQRLPSVANTLH
jgi:hypothetical protein